MNFGWYYFITLLFSKGEGYKRKSIHLVNGGIQIKLCLIIRYIPCLYFIWPNLMYLINNSDSIIFIYIWSNDQSQGFISKYWFKPSKLSLFPQVIFHDNLNCIIVKRDLLPNTPFTLTFDGGEKLFLVRNAPLVAFESPPQILIAVCISAAIPSILLYS